MTTLVAPLAPRTGPLSPLPHAPTRNVLTTATAVATRAPTTALIVVTDGAMAVVLHVPMPMPPTPSPHRGPRATTLGKAWCRPSLCLSMHLAPMAWDLALRFSCSRRWWPPPIPPMPLTPAPSMWSCIH